MKHILKFRIFYLLLILLIFAGCQPKEDQQVELAKADQVFQNYFNGISKFDYQAMRNACALDFTLFEDGVIWTVDDHINFLKPYEGKANISYRFTDVKKSIEGPIAWRTHRNIADATIEGKPVHFEWLESVVLKRQNGEWKIVHLHSTTAQPLQK